MTFSLVYNSYTITEAMQVDKFSYFEGYDKAQISVDFILEAASASALTTLDIAAAVALTAWDKNLVFTYGGTHRDYSHAGNTGFLARPKLSKPGSPQDTETSRRYRWTCEISLPADATDDGGRQSGEWHVLYEPSKRRRVVVSGVYTATVDHSAYDNASTNGPTWAASVISDLGGTYDATTHGDFTVDHRNKVCRYSRVYREQVENDKEGGQQSGVIDSTLSYSQTWPARFGTGYSDTGSGQPPTTVTAEYRCTLDTTTITTADTAETLYRTVLKPWLLTELRTALNLPAHPEASGQLVTIDPGETFFFSRSTCEMWGRITLMAPDSGQARTFYSESITIEGDVGVTSDKLWTGTDHTYSRWGVGQTQRATQVVTIKQLGSSPQPPDGLAEPWKADGPFREVHSSETLGYSNAQHSGGKVVPEIEFARTWVRSYLLVMDEPAGSGSETTPGGKAGVSTAQPGGGSTFRLDSNGNVQIQAVAGAR